MKWSDDDPMASWLGKKARESSESSRRTGTNSSSDGGGGRGGSISGRSRSTTAAVATSSITLLPSMALVRRANLLLAITDWPAAYREATTTS